MVRKTVPMVAFWREKDLSETLSLAGRLLRFPPTSFCRFSTSTLADGKTTKIYSLINTSQVSSRQLPSVSERRLFWKAHWMHLSIRIWACWYRCLSSPSSTSSLLPHHTTSPQEKTKNTYTHTHTYVFDPYKLKTLPLHYSYSGIWQLQKRAQACQSKMNLKQVTDIREKRKTLFK